MEKLNLEKLREKAIKNHLTEISFKKDHENITLITITAQRGNKDGHIVKLVLTDTGNVLDIKYEIGGYSSFRTVLETIEDIFTIINSDKTSKSSD